MNMTEKHTKIKKSKNHILYIDKTLDESLQKNLKSITLKSYLMRMARFRDLTSGYIPNITPRIGNYRIIEVFTKGADEYSINWTLVIHYKQTPTMAVKIRDYEMFGLEESKIYILQDDPKSFRILSLILQNRFGLYKKSITVISFLPTLSVSCYTQPTIIEFTDINNRAIGVRIKPVNTMTTKEFDYILSVKDAVHQQVIKEWFMGNQY